jgi:hypothetical protein
VKPQLPDDDVAQHLSVQERLRRLESATAAISVDPDGLGFRIGGIHERWGVEVLTWSGAANSNTITVAHGLGIAHPPLTCWATSAESTQNSGRRAPIRRASPIPWASARYSATLLVPCPARRACSITISHSGSGTHTTAATARSPGLAVQPPSQKIR